MKMGFSVGELIMAFILVEGFLGVFCPPLAVLLGIIIGVLVAGSLLMASGLLVLIVDVTGVLIFVLAAYHLYRVHQGQSEVRGLFTVFWNIAAGLALVLFWIATYGAGAEAAGVLHFPVIGIPVLVGRFSYYIEEVLNISGLIREACIYLVIPVAFNVVLWILEGVVAIGRSEVSYD